MSAAIGIKAQPSRFAVLMKDSDSDDDEAEVKTTPRTQTNSKGVAKHNKKGESASLKNAKRRARKKKNQSKESQNEVRYGLRSCQLCMSVRLSTSCTP